MDQRAKIAGAMLKAIKKGIKKRLGSGAKLQEHAGEEASAPAASVAVSVHAGSLHPLTLCTVA